jgi:hypothetical protein
MAVAPLAGDTEGASWAMTCETAPAMMKTSAEAGGVLRGMAVGFHVGS